MTSSETRRQQAAADMLIEIDEDGKGLTDWEINFVAAVINKSWRNLTSRQVQTIMQIHEERV